MRDRGFTLIEVMVSVAILAMMSTLVWSSFKQTSLTKKNVESQALRYRTVRLALDRMAKELTMAFLSQDEDPSQPERRTRFVGKPQGHMHNLTFSYFGHQRLYEDAPEGDTAVVMYFSEPDREKRGTTNLMRRESRRLGNIKPEDLSGETDVMCDDVVQLKVTYYDSRAKEWREEWNTTSADGQPDRLPSKVKIVLTVHDERGQEVPFTTQVHIAMQEPLNLRATDATAPTSTTATKPAGTAATTAVTTPTTTTGTTTR
ncbi:MAG: prepilin-type N-terminal cleavage/methylation domain-containing protein [Polyangia bacterium]